MNSSVQMIILLIAACTILIFLYSMDIKRLVEKPNFAFWPGTQLDGAKSSMSIVYNDVKIIRNAQMSRNPSTVNDNDDSHKRKIIVFIAISSHPRRLSRRTAIRKTWMSECKVDPESQCNFIMDTLDHFGKPVANSSLDIMRSESAKHDNDIIFLETFGGNNMGYRMAKTMQYVMDRFQIEFFLRLDDDHFLCYDRLIKELPQRRVENRQLYWGYYWQCNEVGKNLLNLYVKLLEPSK